MSKGKIIKLVLIAVSLCASLYHAAQFMDVLGSAKGQQGSAGLEGLLPKSAIRGVNGGQDPKALLAQLGLGQAAPPADGASKPIVVFSPKGAKLTKEQQEALQRAAERNRPEVVPKAPSKRE